MRGLQYQIGILFGFGLLPIAPGTWGSLAALPIIYGVAILFSTTGLVVLTLSAILLSLWTSDEAVRRLGDDPSEFVMDEVAGQSFTFLLITFGGGLSHDLTVLLGGFILFRLFDIFKPLGIDPLQKLPGKYGILCDDLLAGFYALICIEATYFAIQSII